MTRRGKRPTQGIHTKAVKAWLRERTLVMMLRRKEARQIREAERVKS